MKTCSLCGYEFDTENMVCHAGCPLASHCAVVCCPNCGYQMVDESQSKSVVLARKLQALWQQKRNAPV